MRLIRGQHNLRACHRGSVVTVGNFDGVHLGHQAILEQLVAKAKELGCLSTVMLFEPQPSEFFAPEQAPARILPLRDKLKALAGRGIDQVVCIHFNKKFSSQTAQEFVDKLLINGLYTRHLVVGDDFRFGAGREGDFAFLQRAGQAAGFSVSDTPTVLHQGERVSSTRIRRALASHDFPLASALLGRRYCISGRVRYGDRLGRTLDCPTANLRLPQHAAIGGIYAVKVNGQELDSWPGVASCGTRPTVKGEDNRLEVHLLDYSGNLYGQYLEVELVTFIRPEENFDGLEPLKAAIANDIAITRTYFQQQDT